MSKRYTVARLSRGGSVYEVLVDPEAALSLKMGAEVPVSKFLVYEEVYRDSRKGIRANAGELSKAFGTTDVREIALRIVREGDLQITAEQRRRLVEEKKRQIIDFISKNAVDPRTNTPIPPQRLELALEEAGISIDPFTEAKKQIPRIVERLRMVLPIKIGVGVFIVRVPPDAQPSVQRHIRPLGKILKEEWGPDGWWRCELEAPAGLLNDLVEFVNRYSGGRGDVKPGGAVR